MDLGKCPCGGVTLDKLIRPAILTVLAEGDLHGYALVQRIAGMPMFRGESPDAAGVYRTLRALSREGLLTCAWDLSGSGPAKRSYRLARAGRECLRMWADTLERYRDAIDELLLAARGAAGASGPARRGPARCAGRRRARKRAGAPRPCRTGRNQRTKP